VLNPVVVIPGLRAGTCTCAVRPAWQLVDCAVCLDSNERRLLLCKLRYCAPVIRAIRLR